MSHETSFTATGAALPADNLPDRRDFVGTLCDAGMAGGLVAGYGMFVVMAGRYLFPAAGQTARMFVTDVKSIAPGESLPFQSPAGVKVLITRKAGAPADRPAQAEDFIALSSICPHLGCRVHWEPHNNRFFCPCHNGVFDPSGKATEGPPAKDGQSLQPYKLVVDDKGLLFIELPSESLTSA